MDSSSSNDDEEPKICTVFASSESSGSKTVFDTIAFSSTPKKENSNEQPSPSASGDPNSSTLSLKDADNTQIQTSILDAFNLADNSTTATLFSQPPLSVENVEITSTTASATFDIDHHQEIEATSYIPISTEPDSFGNNPLPTPVEIFGENSIIIEQQQQTIEVTQDFIAEDASKQLEQAIEGLSLEGDSDQFSNQTGQGEGQSVNATKPPEFIEEVESPIPTAKTLFADAPDVPFLVGPFASQAPLDPNLSSSSNVFLNQNQVQVPKTEPLYSNENIFQINPQPKIIQKPIDTFSTLTHSPIDAAYDAWIPKEETSKILMSIATAVHSGTYFPDKSHMTTPGIIYEDDLIDKVGVNMARIFGEAEASKRRILTADSVTQDDNGLRELIKLGCYRSAINLTKRLLTLYGQGPGKVGQFSKHNPHTLQLWFTRISLLIRIREFAIAESEIDAFKEFDNPDLYYEYYPDSYGIGRKGSMVPFNFRLLAAEILQYSRKHNETIDRLTKILYTTQKILQHVEDGISEDGSGVTIDGDRKTASLEIWRKREIRIYYSLANASLFAKDYNNTFKYLNVLCEKDKDKEPQLKSSIGRLFLQVGDLTTANKYFQLAADIRNGDSDSEQVENLVDSGMISIAQGAYPEAFALLQQALLIQPDNFMITNNMAVCLLYMGKVKESLSLMETTVKNNTPQLLQENVLLNLSTIYELENTDGHKKNSLLKLISEYKGDGINLASLKMPNLI